MTAVAAHAELVPPASLAAEECVPVNPFAREESVEMTAAAMNHVESALPLKLAKMESAQELLSPNAPEESVETTELEEVVELAQPDKDAETEPVSAITTVMRETVGLLSNQKGLTSDFAHKPLAGLAPPGSSALLLACALPWFPVTLM